MRYLISGDEWFNGSNRPVGIEDAQAHSGVLSPSLGEAAKEIARKIVQNGLTAHESLCNLQTRMSKAGKTLAKILSGRSDNNVTMDEAIYVLERAGFIWDGGRGSHRVYRHPDERKITLTVHGSKIKPVYVREIRNLLRK